MLEEILAIVLGREGQFLELGKNWEFLWKLVEKQDLVG